MSVRLSSCLVLACIGLCHQSVAQTTLTVAAAADLSTLEPALLASFGKTAPASRISVRFVNEASAVLAQQIQNGAPYDVFLSANASYVDRLASFGKLDSGSVRSYATGRLGILWRDGKQHPINDLTQNWVRFVALANPKLAPYGAAAQQSLQHAGIWQAVQPKLVYGENVRQALQLFDSGNADVVLTASSLLQGRDVGFVPQNWHQPIIQKAGIVATTRQRAAAQTFLDFLLTPAGRAVFARFGFGPP